MLDNTLALARGGYFLVLLILKGIVDGVIVKASGRGALALGRGSGQSALLVLQNLFFPLLVCEAVVIIHLRACSKSAPVYQR